MHTENDRSIYKDVYNLDVAYKIACEQVARLGIEQQCQKSGASCQAQGSHRIITLLFLNERYQFTLPEIEFSKVEGAGDVPLRERILMLHYFIQAKGSPLSGRMITYKELQEGINYFPIFYKRAIGPLVNNFGSEPQRLLNAAETLGGHKADYGDAAATINVFSRVPITLVLWKGDEEFAPEGNIMFDSTISDYLTNDDIHVLCETIAWRLVRLAKAGGDNPGKSRR